jgi:hypothetical protein
MNLREFVLKRLDADERTAHEAAEAIGNGEWGSGPLEVRSARLTLVAHTVVPDHIARHDPARVLRAVKGARNIASRHTNDPTSRYDALACIGCPTNETDGGYTIDNIDECPELQDLAWRWHLEEGWNPKWCPHYDTDLIEETAHDDRGPVYLKNCTHCGAGLGREYSADWIKRTALHALGLNPHAGVHEIIMGAETLTIELTTGDYDFPVRDLTTIQRGLITAYLNHPWRTT